MLAHIAFHRSRADHPGLIKKESNFTVCDLKTVERERERTNVSFTASTFSRSSDRSDPIIFVTKREKFDGESAAFSPLDPGGALMHLTIC